ncbi:MAG TPA: hypothetical protein DCY88_21065 [Cyanobacteria bacterium UBA11372]|nr:hypothetical protein [Cyanobacteria bacterium UBA11372]
MLRNLSSKFNHIDFERAGWRILIIILLVMGVFFRWVNIEKKVYWFDETFTSLRVSGYSLKEVEQELKQKAAKGETISIKELHKYQHPSSEKNVTNLVNGLAAEEPQLPPLYFIMLRFWQQWLGDGVTVRRSLSVIISWLAFPCIYWLCQELFGLPLVGWVAMGLIAISPIHLLYAQEVRSYSLWTVTILFASAAMLRAMRRGTKLSWGVYACALALGLYAHALSILVAIGHGLYAIANEGFKFNKVVRNYLLASGAGILLFLPWIMAIITNFSKAAQTTNWSKDDVFSLLLFKSWILNISRAFFDLNDSFTTKNLSLYLVKAILIILVVYSLYYIVVRTEKKTWLFILTLIGVTALFLILPDLILGGKRSSAARYVIPCYLGIQIAVAYMLATKISVKLWRIALVAVISSGVISCAVISQKDVWWTKYSSFNIPDVAKIINQADQPLLISYGLLPLDLSYLLSPKVKFQLADSQNIVTTEGKRVNKFFVNSLGNSFSDVFILAHNHPASDLVEDLLAKQKTYRLKETYTWKYQSDPVFYSSIRLWKLVKGVN